MDDFLKRYSLRLLRYSMALIYFWFGILKVIGISPVEEFVLRSSSWVPVPHFVIVLGIFEMVIGICLFWKPLLRIGLALLFLQLCGTFLTIFLIPEDIFTIIPYGLTLEGEFVFKNLILFSVGLVLASSLNSDNSPS